VAPLLLCLLTALPGAEAKDIETKVLQKINDSRKLTGLPPVAVDAELSKGCVAHAQYLLQNQEALHKGKINVHDEEPKLPGYSAAGRKAARSAVIAETHGTPDPLLGVDLWIGSFYHRIPLLDPTLKKVGLGFADEKGRDWFLVVDTGNGKVRAKDTFKVICYPVDGQKEIPLLFSVVGAPESPNPIPNNGDSKKTGFPITVAFFQERAPLIRNVIATLKDEEDNEVPTWLSWPEKPAVKNFGRNAICLIPKEPLRPETTYTVTVKAKVNGKDWKSNWSFTTGKK
jgi:hypothetical protein